MPARQLDEAVQLEATRLYDTGLSIHAVAKQLGIGHTGCHGAIKRHGQTRPAADFCTVNETFFDVIDSETKAYWLGFLTADGHVNERSVRLRLAARDVEHVRAFTAAVESTHRVTVRDGVVQLAVTSRALAAGLCRLGFTHDKSKTAHPVVLPAELEAHYWRGLVDGDGSVSWRTSKRHRNGRKAWIRLIGTARIVDGFRAFIRRVLNIDNTRRSMSTIWVVDYECSSAVQVARLLYSSATVALSRKHEAARLLWNGA